MSGIGGQNSGRQIITTDDWMRRIETRLMHEERRPLIRTASDLMGPGLGPRAVHIQDWNADATLFNGFFFTEPGAAQHSPDNTKHWMGYSVANENGNGYQRVYEYRDEADPTVVTTYVRRFRTPSGLSRIFEAWVLVDSGGGSATGLLLCKISATADQALTSGSAAFTIFNTVNVDTGGMADLANNRILIPKTGYYRATARATFASNATGLRAVLINVGPTTVDEDYRMAVSNSTTISTVTTEAILMNAGDYVQFRALQISGASLNLTLANGRYSYIQVDWV